MLLKQESLAKVFDDMAERIRERDSIEGHLKYEFAKVEVEDGERVTYFEVTGTYRHGNSDGQGGVRIFESSAPPEHNRRAEDQTESSGEEEDFDDDTPVPDDDQPIV